MMFFKTSFKKTLILMSALALFTFFSFAQESDYSYEDYLRDYEEFLLQSNIEKEDVVEENQAVEEVEVEVGAEVEVEVGAEVEVEVGAEVEAEVGAGAGEAGTGSTDEVMQGDENVIETEAPAVEEIEVPAEDTSAPEEVPAPTPSAESQEEKHEYQALALIRYKNTDSISFKFKVSYIPKPYILGLSFAAGFTEYKMFQPFYFGGYLEPHVGIPQKKFPYQYSLNGKTIKGPLIIGGKLYTPIGICVFPFQENIEFFVEFAPGLSLNMMWDAKFGKNSITSKLYPAFYGMLRTGATYKGFTLFIEGNYDAILGFGVSAGIGYSLNFDLGERN